MDRSLDHIVRGIGSKRLSRALSLAVLPLLLIFTIDLVIVFFS